MAEGGSDFNLSVKGSDVFYDLFPCIPCERNGRNSAAVKHCTDCDENLCKKCLNSHNELATARLHTVLDKVQTCQKQTAHLPSRRCSKHVDKIIDVFCPAHDIVGCSDCIFDDHSACKGKKLIHDVATDIKTSKGLEQLETEMKTIETKLNYLKESKNENLQRLKQDQADLKEQIKSVRKKMNEQLDRMEKELVDEVDTKFQEKIDAIQSRIAGLDDMLAKVKHDINQINGDDNDADIFVSYKVAKWTVSTEIGPATVREEERRPERSFQLHTYEYADLIMEGERMFASIKDKYMVQNAEHKEDINVSVSDDASACRVTAMCTLPDGYIVMADVNNNKLKTIDPVSNMVSTLINLPDSPIDVCLVDDTSLAVSMYNLKKIQFVSLSSQVTLGSSFCVGDRCWCLAHCDGLMYVCCEDSSALGSKQGRGHVEVYDSDGELLRCLFKDLCFPEYIDVVSDDYSTTMYISDSNKGILVYGMDGVVKNQFPSDLNTGLPFCLIGTDQLCIGERSSGNIYIQTDNERRVLIDTKDVKGDPISVYFDDRSSRLFVAMSYSNVFKIFKLNE